MDAARRGGGREACADSQTPLPPDCRKNTNVAASGSAASTLFRSASVRVW